MDFLGNILSGQDLVNKDYVDKAIPVVPTKLSEFTDDILSGKYLLLSGGSIDGNLSVNNGNIVSSYASGGIILSNGASFYFKDSTGTNRKVVRLASGNVLQLGSTALETAITSGGTITLSANTSVNGILSVATDITTPLINGGTPIHSGNYSSYALPLSGGTIESSSSSSPLIIKTSSNAWLMFRNTAGYLGEFGFTYQKIAHCTDADGNARVLLHAGNYSNYALPLSGGTIAGNGAGLLAINRKDGNPVIEFHYNGSIMGRYGFATDGTPIGVVAGSQVTLIHSGNVGNYNAGSATKLQTARTIWGQSFDGTGNVSGALSGVANINSALYINSSGNVGIGTASPEYKLDVNGKARVSDELVVTNPTGIRWAYGDYGTLFRNDGQNFYILFTDSGGALTGSWNSLRPFRISLTTGDVTMEHNLSVEGQIVAGREMSSENRFVLFAPYAESKGVSFGYMKATIANQYNIGIAHLGTNYGGTATITDTSMDYTAISMYRHVVGIGKEYDYTSIRAIYDAGADLGVTKGILVGSSKMLWDGVGLSVSTGATFNGAVTMSSTLSVGGLLTAKNGINVTASDGALNTGQSGVAGVFLRNEGGIEISHAATPYIDFHFANSTSDFNHRLIAKANNIFAYSGNYFCPWGSESLGASSYRWQYVYAKAGSFSNDMEINGALTVGAGAIFNGDVRINGNLVVTGDTASGGAAGGASVGSLVTFAPTYDSGLSLGSITIDGIANSIYAPQATDSDLGLVKASAVRTSAITATTGGTTSGRYYGVEMDSNGKMFVNVPWTDTVSGEGGGTSAHSHLLNSVNGNSYPVSNGDVIFSTSSSTTALDFRGVIPTSDTCVIYIVKSVSCSLSIPVVATSGIRMVNQTSLAAATATIACAGVAGLMLIWDAQNAIWTGYILK